MNEHGTSTIHKSTFFSLLNFSQIIKINFSYTFLANISQIAGERYLDPKWKRYIHFQHTTAICSSGERKRSYPPLLLVLQAGDNHINNPSTLACSSSSDIAVRYPGISQSWSFHWWGRRRQPDGNITSVNFSLYVRIIKLWPFWDWEQGEIISWIKRVRRKKKKGIANNIFLKM